MIFTVRFSGEAARHVTVDAWARETTISKELLEKGDQAIFRHDPGKHLLTIVVENGTATYRTGDPIQAGALHGGGEGPSHVVIPIALLAVSGEARIA